MATTVATTRRQDVAQEQSRTPAERDRLHLQPPVDIVEDGHGIMLYADLPGVDLNGLGVHVEGDTLFIEGTGSLALPQGAQPVYAEQRSLNFRRRFSLSGDLDTTAIEAKLANGVLTVRIPKTPAAQPRRIDVQAG
jgi:HSP20 family molecular chaperone IbpA